MDTEQLKEMQVKFRQGLEKLDLLGKCLAMVGQAQQLELHLLGLDSVEGEFAFRFAGTKYYVRIRLTDRQVGYPGAAYSVPTGWLDWGRYGLDGRREPPEQTNYFEERGILVDLDKDEFYCNFASCEDERLQRGLLQKLSRLVERTIAQNNVRSL